ncbi:MAG: arylsulfatase [Planctomycetota bacterium]|jgi:arylsulfatase A-like enzyme
MKVTATILLLAAVPTCLSLSVPAQSDRPNVVLIIADDLGWGELGSYGQKLIRTPNLDRLAAQGMRLTQAYSGAPTCAPSRNVLMTGKHLGHTTIRGNRPARNAEGKLVEGQHPIPAEALTIAEVFRDAGYATGAMGKWGLGPVGSTGDPNAQGFDHFYGYNCQRVAHSYYPPHVWDDAKKVMINAKPIPGRKRQPEGEVKMEDWFDETYAPDLILDEALKFIGEHKDQPFFLYLPFIEPHVAMQPPADLVESYPEDWDDREYRGQCGYLPHPRPRAGYAAMITDLDEHVGAVMAALEEQGLAENTLVIFSSDNGTTHGSNNDPVFGIGGVDAAFFNSTAGLRGFKGSVYEGGLRVPFIARWPGQIEAGSESDQPTYFPDLFATLCEVMGTGVPEHVDGISILPTLTGEGEQAERNPMVWVFAEYGGQVALRFGKWKLVRQGLKRRNGPDPWELYDMEADRSEEDNVAADHPEVVEAGIAILRREMGENELFPVPVPELR